MLLSIRFEAFWRRQLTREAQFSLDLITLALSFALAYLLRFDFAPPAEQQIHFLVQLPMVVLIQFVAIYATGVYRFVWRFIGLSELGAFTRAAMISAIPLAMLRLGLPDAAQSWRVPLSIIVIDTGLAFASILILRVVRRVLWERWEQQRGQQDQPHQRALLLGAGRAGLRVAQEAKELCNTPLEIIGFVDDDSDIEGNRVAGIPILGQPSDLPELVEEHDIQVVVITKDRASRRQIRRLVEACEALPVEMKILPALSELLDGSVTVNRLREVRIDDLLGREPAELNEDNLTEFLSGRRVMVTGAGGSIGSEIVRQVSRYSPSAVVLVERSEPSLFGIDTEVSRLLPETPRSAYVTDVNDEQGMRQVFAHERPQVVFHAAAHKHVPMLEKNVAEAVKNNVIGTRTVGRLAGEFGVSTFVLISTDKAVRPSSIMGATKRLAELVIQDLDAKYPTSYMAVRFGNVLGSAGSVIPVFREQIERGGPVTVTHEDMVRFFMTIPEASQLVLQAGAIGAPGEVLMLDMGEPVRILDLAKDMIQLSGLKPYEDIDIFITGIRPGEKLAEELELTDEHFRVTSHRKIFAAVMAKPLEAELLERTLATIEKLADNRLDDELRWHLADIVPEARLTCRRPTLVPERHALRESQELPELVLQG